MVAPVVCRMERNSAGVSRRPSCCIASCCASTAAPATCGVAWLVPEYVVDPPVGPAPVIWPPGANTSSSDVERCEKLAMRSGPVARSFAPLANEREPTSESYTAPMASALGSAAG